MYRNYPEFVFFGACAKDSLQCVTPGVYAMVGAAATLAGVTRLTGKRKCSLHDSSIKENLRRFYDESLFNVHKLILT